MSNRSHRRFPPPRAAAARHIALAILALLVWIASARAQHVRLDPGLFPVPDELADNVAFWTRVYTAYDSNTVLLHDERHLHVVYAAIDFSELNGSELSEGRKSLLRRRRIQELESKYRKILEDLAAGRAPKSHRDDQRRVEQLFAKVPGDRSRYSAARYRMRTQTCLADRFAEGIERSGVYLAAIEDIFRRRGLPVELTRLPFVESLFQWHARSSASAGGIWQFVPSTARLYLAMELEYDERFDPLEASEAAARYLAESHEALGTWPLAITAYNHGRAGVRRAVRRLGTRDLGQIATRYRSRSFGFASRNFYAEFIAAATVYENRSRYFPDTSPLSALRYAEFAPELYVPVRELARASGVELSELREMNPALAREVWAGNLYLPKGYPLRVPAGRAADFERAFEALPANLRSPHQVGLYYRVRSGDTLSSIARKFGSSVRVLQRANKLASPHRIRIGQRLLIPPRAGHGSSRAASGPTTHVVRSGDTLTAIARRYGTTVRALKEANRIASHIIHPRQVLVIP